MATDCKDYEPVRIESHWQDYWKKDKTFRAVDFSERPKFYVLDMFPYPSGAGLHVGHPLGYIATDIFARYKRMRGFNVLHPMGFDAFGLPAEQFAVEHGVHPRVTTGKNVANMVRQLKRLGLSYDWDRAFATTDVDYYRWTQWIFLQLYHSWFDPGRNRARPIDDLVEMLESGKLRIGRDRRILFPSRDETEDGKPDSSGGRDWNGLSETEKREVLAAHRLAYLADVHVNWCPALGTVLANEEVTNEGRSERGNYPVYQRPLKQWMLRITDYVKRLEDELDLVDWPEPIKLMQHNWIGRSEGAVAHFPVGGEPATDAAAARGESAPALSVFTTRPDTLFGATYMVLAPEHPLVDQLATPDRHDAVAEYKRQAARRTELERQADAKTKSGVFTGAFAVNPVNNERIPIWIADYVLMAYGTGAIMAVPAHDERDFEFAKQFQLPIRAVVMPGDDWLKEQADKTAADAGINGAPIDEIRRRYIRHPDVFPEAFVGQGLSINSSNDEVSLDNLATPDAKRTISRWLKDKGLGRTHVQYKLRDWLFSRQRYWGEPFPILHGPDGEILAVEEDELPVELPEMEDFRPHGSDDPDAPPRPPLGRAPESWRFVERNGVRYQRELNTMPQWAGSCWYYLRFCDPDNRERFAGPEAERYWMLGGKAKGQAENGGVDLYVVGAEHAVLHLLYARFWHKVLHDLGHVSSPEPFGRLFNQGYIQAFYYEDERGMRVPADKVVDQDGKPAEQVQDEPDRRFFFEGKPVTQRYGKMGKSLKNAVTPDDMCEEYGADALRAYLMFLGPLEAMKTWNTQGIEGISRFLKRIWREYVDRDGNRHPKIADTAESNPDTLRLLHETIKKVGEDIEELRFNTAISQMMIFVNHLQKAESFSIETARSFLKLLAPFAPHLAEELWARLDDRSSISAASWPEYDPARLEGAKVKVVFQVNGKYRGDALVDKGADQDTVLAAAKDHSKVAAHLEGKTVRKVIYVPGRILNIVVS